MSRTVIINGEIVRIPDPRPTRIPPTSRLLALPVGPRRANSQSYPTLARPPTMTAGRYEMLLTIREYMNLSAMGEVLVFGASKEIEYPFLCTPCCHITMVSDDDNDVDRVLARLGHCTNQQVQLLKRTSSTRGVTLRVDTGGGRIPLTITMWKMTYGDFRKVAPSKRYDCLIDKASWLYTDPQGWAEYLYKLKVDGYLITDLDYTWEGTAPWVLEVFGLYEVTNSVVGYHRAQHVGYGYDNDSARVYVKVKDVPTSLMHKALLGVAQMDPLLKLYRYPRMNLVGSYLDWDKYQAQANLLRAIAQHARQLDPFRYGSLARRLDQVHQQLTQWIHLREQEDIVAGEHYRQ